MICLKIHHTNDSLAGHFKGGRGSVGGTPDQRRPVIYNRWK